MADKVNLFDGIDLDFDDDIKTPKNPINPEYFNTEGVDSGDYDEYENLDVKEQQEKIRKLQIGNEKELRNLVEKPLIKAILAEIGQAIQVGFVHAGRREAPAMAQRLGIPERTRDLEKMIDDINEKGINGVIAKIETLMDEEVYE